MKDDFLQDEKSPTNNKPSENSSLAHDESLDWAKQAYLQLKQKQKEEKEIREKERNEKEISNAKDLDNNIHKNVNEDLESNILVQNKLLDSEDLKEEDQIKLGDFDDTFTWSAEVLAAQGKKVDQFSLDDIDWLSRLKQGLEKTRKGFVTDLLDKLGDDPLTPEVLDDLETLLLRADAGVSATDQILDSLRTKLNEEVVEASEGLRFLKEQLVNVLEKPIKDSGVDLLSPKKGCLNIWMLVGVNGVGKTTTLGKLASVAKRSGFSAMIAAADTFRAAAVQQVKVWGERTGVEVIANESKNADPASIVFDAIGASKSKNIDLLLVDTAGRLQTKNNLMEELKKIRKIIDKLAPQANVESLLVLDSSQGQNGLRQALAFADSADLTGVILTKLDGSSRGGVAMAVASEAQLPLRFIGAGEKIRDLRPFNSFEFIEALLTNR